MVADAGPPLVLMAIGFVLWVAASSTLGGIFFQTIGVILFVGGSVWLAAEMIQACSRTRHRVVDQPVVYRDRRL